MKKILIPTDFSENAWNALQYALDLYKDETCNFFILNAYSPPIVSPTNPITSASTTKVLLDVAKKSAEEGLAAVMARINESYSSSKHQFETIASYDFLVSAVKETVKEKEIDMVVMGTKGASGLKEVIMGSNTAGVIGHIECPLLAIPEEAVFKPLKELAFATDYAYYHERFELAELLELAQKYNASICVLHALEHKDGLSKEQELVRQHLDELMEPIQHSFHTLTRVSLETATRTFTQSRDIDMLCMVTKHHSFLTRLFGKPRVEEISFHTKIPLLVLKEVS
ncbi:universal stress protein [Leptobacterium sp. I13]|uniref:universal stress protein n=1 Tax=Leptobacterium meishanense TaxID=3128904 RepID=UPI0030EE00ED